MLKWGHLIGVVFICCLLLVGLGSGAQASGGVTPSRLPADAPPYPGIYIQYDNPADNLDAAHGYAAAGGHMRYGWDILEPDFDDDYRFDEVILPWVEAEASRGKMVGIAFSTYAGRQYGGITVPAWLWARDHNVRLYNNGWYLLNYLNRTYISEYVEFVRAFAAWSAATPVVRDHLAWVEVGAGLFGENQPTANNSYDGVDHTYYATQAPGGSLASGWSAADWAGYVNQIVAAYRDAFDDAGLRGVPVLTNIAPTFRDPWERDSISDAAAAIGAGLKHAGLLADHNNADNSYRPMRKYAEADPPVPVTWETYGHPWGTSYAEWCWMVWCALAKHPDVFMITRDQLADAQYLPSTATAARYLGVSLETTPDVWVALRESFRDDTWDRPEKGNYSFWLYQVDDAMGRTVVETGRDDAITQGDTNRLGLPVYNPVLGGASEGWTTRRTSQADGNPYMWFDIDDRYISGAVPVQIKVTYFDLGYDFWSLNYMSPNGMRSAGAIQKGNTRQWRTATLNIADGVFGNGLGGKYDFRIDCRNDGDEWIHLVRVTKAKLAWVEPDQSWAPPYRTEYLTAVFADARGWSHIRYADVLLNSEMSDSSGLAIRYDVAAGKLSLYQPLKAWWLTPLTPGVPGVSGHVYGKLDAGLSSVVKSSRGVTLTLAITPTWRMSGQLHNIYLRTEDVGGANTGWVDRADWTVNCMPNWLMPPTQNLNVALDLAAGPYWFDPGYRDLDGHDDLAQLYFLITDGVPTNDSEDIPGSVYLKYDQGENEFYLRSRDGTTWLGGVAPLTSFRLSNELVTVRGPGSRVIVADAKTFRVRYYLEFDPAFRGRHKVYMRAIDIHGAALGGDTGWKWKGWVELR